MPVNRSIARVMVKVTDLDCAVEFAEKVLGARFLFVAPYNPNSKSGLRSAICVEPGLELMQVVGEDGDIAMFDQPESGRAVFEFLRDAPVGIVGAVYDMEDVEAARAEAEARGIDVIFKYDFTPEQLDKLGWGYSKYVEYFLNPAKTGNGLVLLADIRK